MKPIIITKFRSQPDAQEFINNLNGIECKTSINRLNGMVFVGSYPKTVEEQRIVEEAVAQVKSNTMNELAGNLSAKVLDTVTRIHKTGVSENLQLLDNKFVRLSSENARCILDAHSRLSEKNRTALCLLICENQQSFDKAIAFCKEHAKP